MSSVSKNSRSIEKRSDYISWEEYFMGTALLAAQRSKDPCTQVGACIVNNKNKIVGVGYNGFPKGCSDDHFSWANRKMSPFDNKHFYVCHAEMNAVLNMSCGNAEDCKIYVTLFPCNECAKFIIQSGIKEVIYMSDKYYYKPETEAAKKMFTAAEVSWREFSTNRKSILLAFNENDSNGESQLHSPKKSKKPYKEEPKGSSN